MADKDESSGLRHPKAIISLILWYIFSFASLMLNKYIMYDLKSDATLLGMFHLLACCILGYVHMLYPCGMHKATQLDWRYSSSLYKNLVICGGYRFLTVILGLVTLKYIPVSFTETIKSSAPLFTVFIARTVLSEETSSRVIASLVPIMIGLVLCSTYELSFSLYGFILAMGTNVTECLHNVYSKLLLNDEKVKFTAAEMQFYTSALSFVVQLPCCWFLMDFEMIQRTWDLNLIVALTTNGVLYHFQTITSFYLIEYISTVTYSVCNTVKRALMIWLSVLIIGNEVTFLSGLGTAIVIFGVFFYNKFRAMESLYPKKMPLPVVNGNAVVVAGDK